jgi:DNA ligase (NAD+)
MHAKENDFDTIHDIGPVMKNEIMTWLHNPHNQNAVSNLLKVGVCPVQNKILSQKLTQKVFVFTGTLKSMTRETASSMVVAQGGKVAPSLHSQVTHLVVGENPGSKVAEAKRKSITIVGEEEFLSMLHG